MNENKNKQSAENISTRKTFCRICEAHCGLAVEVDLENDEQIISVKPDKQHPVSKGYACIKGASLGALHHDPDRLKYPLKRINGKLERISWNQAITEIGERVKGIRKQHGNRAVAMYQGNPTYFSFQNIMYSSAFLESIHSPNIFASHSIDGNNKYEAVTQMYGRSMVHPIPDLKNTDFFMCFGSNPAVSQMSIITVINPIQKFKDIEARGGKVVFVDPRRNETAAKVGDHVFIKPGADVYLLLAMLHVITHEHALDTSKIEGFANNIERFIENARAWTPERAEKITGIEAANIRALALQYRDARGAALYMSTGVNMGPFGTLSYWLIQGLNLITGNLDKKGGLLVPRGAFDAVKLASMIGLGGFDEHRTLVNNWHRVAGCFPVSALAEEITVDDPDKIRALFVSAGNPMHSVPNGKALAAAMKTLDLMVCVDIYPSETSSLADYVLPATDMLERADYPVSHMVLQETPHAQYTPAVVKPQFERRPEWQIYSDLAVACGASPFGASVCNIFPHVNRWLAKIPLVGAKSRFEAIQPDHLLSLLLKWGGHVSLKELKNHPEGVLLAETQAGSFLGKRVPTDDGKVELWPTNLILDIPRLDTYEAAFAERNGQLQLIGQRERRTHNSWMHNNPNIKQGDGNKVLMHPHDAKHRQIKNKDLVKVSTQQGAVQLAVSLTDSIAAGVIAIPHGWGQQGKAMKRAAKLAGDNINKIIPGGRQHMEPASGQAIMLGHFVDVVKVEVTEQASTEVEEVLYES